MADEIGQVPLTYYDENGRHEIGMAWVNSHGEVTCSMPGTAAQALGLNSGFISAFQFKLDDRFPGEEEVITKPLLSTWHHTMAIAKNNTVRNPGYVPPAFQRRSENGPAE